ncbi:hypothetical protein V8C35DRAFT_285717 [Trichoderma chlorosporum]
MARIVRALKRPITILRQAYEDYQVGREIRQWASQINPEDDAKCNDEKCDEKCEKRCDEGCEAERLSQCDEECNDTEASRLAKRNEKARRDYPAQKARSWNFQGEQEFPWRHEQLVCEESNWRGTWVLEVKDMRAMNWGVEYVRREDGRGYKIVRKPTRHLPFPQGHDIAALLPAEGGQDDLLVLLGKMEASGRYAVAY